MASRLRRPRRGGDRQRPRFAEKIERTEERAERRHRLPARGRPRSAAAGRDDCGQSENEARSGTSGAGRAGGFLGPRPRPAASAGAHRRGDSSDEPPAKAAPARPGQLRERAAQPFFESEFSDTFEAFSSAIAIARASTCPRRRHFVSRRSRVPTRASRRALLPGAPGRDVRTGRGRPDAASTCAWWRRRIRDLEEEVERGRFRRDLYYRLSVLPLTVPALRDRREDIVPMARSFLKATARRLHPSPLEAGASGEALLAYDYPGNLPRELQNVIERAVDRRADHPRGPSLRSRARHERGGEGSPAGRRSDGKSRAAGGRDSDGVAP